MSNPRTGNFQLTKARLDWARKRIDEFIAHLDTFLGKDPYRIIAKVQREGEHQLARVSFTIHITESPLETLRFLVGEAIHNLRSTVEGLVWGLGQARGCPDNLGLKFYESQTRFDKDYAAEIDLLPREIKSWILSEQVYNRGNISILQILNRLWNVDKHRAPVLLASAVPGHGVGSLGGSCYVDQFQSVKVFGLEDGDEIAWATVAADDVVRFDANFRRDVALTEDQSGQTMIAREFLNRVHDYIVKYVMPQFEPFPF